jgi:hypothetical protein
MSFVGKLTVTQLAKKSLAFMESIIFLSTPSSPNESLISRSSHQNCVCIYHGVLFIFRPDL